MIWFASLLTLFVIINLAAAYLWFCQRGLERSLAGNREIALFPDIARRAPNGRAQPARDRFIGGRPVGVTANEGRGSARKASASAYAAPATAAPAMGLVSSAPTAKPKARKPKTATARARTATKRTAAPKAKKTATSRKKAAPAFIDDVKLISGVGTVLEKKLAAQGITSLKQVAKMSAKKVSEVEETLNFKGRITRDEWIPQAKDLIAGKPPRAKVDQKAAAKKR